MKKSNLIKLILGATALFGSLSLAGSTNATSRHYSGLGKNGEPFFFRYVDSTGKSALFSALNNIVCYTQPMDLFCSKQCKGNNPDASTTVSFKWTFTSKQMEFLNADLCKEMKENYKKRSKVPYDHERVDYENCIVKIVDSNGNELVSEPSPLVYSEKCIDCPFFFTGRMNCTNNKIEKDFKFNENNCVLSFYHTNEDNPNKLDLLFTIKNYQLMHSDGELWPLYQNKHLQEIMESRMLYNKNFV